MNKGRCCHRPLRFLVLVIDTAFLVICTALRCLYGIFAFMALHSLLLCLSSPHLHVSYCAPLQKRKHLGNALMLTIMFRPYWQGRIQT